MHPATIASRIVGDRGEWHVWQGIAGSGGLVAGE